MATLQGTQINNTYPGLLKTEGNTPLSSTLQAITDGTGVATGIQVAKDFDDLTTVIKSDDFGSNKLTVDVTGSNFTGNVDFTNAFVSGLPAAGNLVNGTGLNSLQQIDGLLDVNADASGSSSIALGRNALASQEGAIGIGNFGRASGAKSIAIGQESTAIGNTSISMGWNNTATGVNSISLGVNTRTSAANSVGIGNYASYLGAFAATSSVMIGQDNGYAGGAQAVSIGYNCTSKASGGIAIGANARIDGSANTNSIAIGALSDALAVGAVALGTGVQASKVATVSVTELETQLAGGGITMKSPNGTEYKLTVSDAGALVIT
tara:strand:- start:3509 stop:4474 length:966 start_codon:yes stop_codon:yes gene_type:complete